MAIQILIPGDAAQNNFADFSFGDLKESESHCSIGCANSWVADKYCDSACSVYDCAFDAGDCGNKNFYQMYHVTVAKNESTFIVPSGHVSLQQFVIVEKSLIIKLHRWMERKLKTLKICTTLWESSFTNLLSSD